MFVYSQTKCTHVHKALVFMAPNSDTTVTKSVFDIKLGKALWFSGFVEDKTFDFYLFYKLEQEKGLTS